MNLEKEELNILKETTLKKKTNKNHKNKVRLLKN